MTVKHTLVSSDMRVFVLCSLMELHRHQNMRVLFLEAAVGFNTPTIVKYSFWRMAYEWKNAMYACLNYGEAFAPEEIKNKSICINGDIGAVLNQIQSA